MPLPFNSASIRKVMGRLVEEAGKKGLTALTEIALVVERQAKVNLTYASHPLHTPTPAIPGKGPGLISGTLRRSITHTRAEPIGLASWRAKVGTAAGFTPSYGKTPSSHYGYLLETGKTRNGVAYPFLGPAVKFGQHIAGPAIYAKHFGRWPRMDL